MSNYALAKISTVRKKISSAHETALFRVVNILQSREADDVNNITM